MTTDMLRAVSISYWSTTGVNLLSFPAATQALFWQRGFPAALGHGRTVIVDYMRDFGAALPIQPYRHHIVETRFDTGRNLYRVVRADRRTYKITVDADTERLMICHPIGDLIRSVTVETPRAHPNALTRYVIRHFGLIEIDSSTLAVPHRLVLLKMLYSQSIHCDVSTVHDQAVVGRIDHPPDVAAMVCAPEPQIIAYNIVAVDGDAARGTTDMLSAAHPAENIVQERWVGCMVARTEDSPTCSNVVEFRGPASKVSPATLNICLPDPKFASKHAACRKRFLASTRHALCICDAWIRYIRVGAIGLSPGHLHIARLRLDHQ